MNAGPLIAIVVPAVALVIGAAAARMLRPSRSFASLAQHVAAGAVLASTSVELVPELQTRSTSGTIAGFAIGIALMLAIRIATRRLAATGPRGAERGTSLPVGLLVTTGFDLAVDGFVLGAAFAVGQAAGLILAVALSVELVFLGISSISALPRGAARVWVVVAAAFAIAFVVGGGVGLLILGSAPQFIMTLVVAIGAVALMYLVLEELLVEAHEAKQSEWNVAALFVGFLAILVLAELAG